MNMIRSHGPIKTIRYDPEDESELTARLMQEHHIETHGLPKKRQKAKKCVSR